GRQLWQRISQWVSLLYLKPCRTYFQRYQTALIHVLTPDPGAAVMIRAGFAADVPVFYQELGTPHYLPELDIHYEWFAKVLPLCVLDACAFLDPYNAPEDKSAFMYGLDVFVLPTLAEGTPNSIIEAMAHGLPVIASAVGGIPDLITPETGMLVPPGNPQALADAMLLLASDPELRARMG